MGQSFGFGQKRVLELLDGLGPRSSDLGNGHAEMRLRPGRQNDKALDAGNGLRDAEEVYKGIHLAGFTRIDLNGPFNFIRKNARRISWPGDRVEA